MIKYVPAARADGEGARGHDPLTGAPARPVKEVTA
ncbi:hypothetical protein J2853_003872 [Streptosporangium lutulentum]|uniref:Uncharacterized protein n=1 Tax=Streptosporangium lutulentum TaxID=1461250 RepID=A0ABT9QD12_9ACTN|nr:hypothetical protein [Streptosporangium lutulentum]